MGYRIELIGGDLYRQMGRDGKQEVEVVEGCQGANWGRRRCAARRRGHPGAAKAGRSPDADCRGGGIAVHAAGAEGV
jgi:hypothetical protein